MCWPRASAPKATNDRLGALAVYLSSRGMARSEIADVIGVEPDTVRRRLLDRGHMREDEVTFSVPETDLSPWRFSRHSAWEEARRLPRVQSVAPAGDDEPTYPEFYVAFADPPPSTLEIRSAFTNAHRACPHSAALLSPAPAEAREAGALDECRPFCLIGDVLGLEPARKVGWLWGDEWLYSCPSWQAARDRNRDEADALPFSPLRGEWRDLSPEPAGALTGNPL